MTLIIESSSNAEKDPDIANSEIAMRRAAMTARKKAYQFGHGVILLIDGKIKEVPVDKDGHLLDDNGNIIEEPGFPKGES